MGGNNYYLEYRYISTLLMDDTYKLYDLSFLVGVRIQRGVLVVDLASWRIWLPPTLQSMP